MTQTLKSKTSARIAWIDMAKGYALLLVMLAHLEYEAPGNLGIIGMWGYTFHIPLFFWLSGYTYKQPGSFKEFMSKKLKSLIIPYFGLGFIFVVGILIQNAFAGKLTLAGAIWEFIQLVLQMRYGTLWFLGCLFFTQLFFFLIYRKHQKPLHYLLACALLTVIALVYYAFHGPALLWNADAALCALPFFGAGYLCKTNSSKIDALLERPARATGFMIVAFVVGILATIGSLLITGNMLDMYWKNYGFPPLVYLSAFAGIAAVVIFSHKLTLYPVTYLGENTLVYFAWHQAIVIPGVIAALRRNGFWINEFSPKGRIALYLIVCMILILIICTLAHLIVSKTKLKWMIGR